MKKIKEKVNENNSETKQTKKTKGKKKNNAIYFLPIFNLIN